MLIWKLFYRFLFCIRTSARVHICNFFVKMVLCVWADKIVLANCKLHSNVMACIDSEVLFVRVCVCVFFFNCASSAIYIFNFHLKQPQTKNGIDTFGGLGATIVDCLDTLFIMGLDEQFQRAREWVYSFLLFFPFPSCLNVYASSSSIGLLLCYLISPFGDVF